MKEGTCKMCGLLFRSSAYWFLMKKSDFPDTCAPCRLATREKLRAQLDGVKQPAKESEYLIEVRTGAKGAKGFGKKRKIIATSEAKPSLKSMRFKDYFQEIDAYFPALPQDANE